MVAEDGYVSFSDSAAKYFNLLCFLELGLYVAASSEHGDFWFFWVE